MKRLRKELLKQKSQLKGGDGGRGSEIQIKPRVLRLKSKPSDNLRMPSAHSHSLLLYANPGMFIKSVQT